MPTRRYVVGRADEATHPDSMRAALAEFLATIIFVFAGEGSVLAFDKMYKGRTTDTSTTPARVVMVALAHGLALFAAVASSMNVSGGHVNPAVTFGALLGGRISVIRALYYWLAQLLGAIAACLLLRLTAGMRPTGFMVAYGTGELRCMILEIVMTFGLVYTVYGTAVDPKRGSMGTIAPLAIGLIVAANILVGGPFDGGAMNPARAFGPALVGWRWNNHWIYWVGPLIGGGLAGLVYEYMIIPAVEPAHQTHQPLAPEDY
ncbi:hypothetical protein F3Y22_tig00110429pilonHSYRG00799 [Hibiscus syriacus]|uniref:Aquaporin TIP3-2 n=1 Tax=Hibiscus syriacus TaxID=106335 RepID=A0A6A3AMV3_HIBSY|nr:probable aquaporin TIP3-2 [Hibiscus syriacus]KAE8705348.1 hypothetical protein F3Y22_tig00110429pilonHSYRG00799 [Hibiscus syriacus]